MGNHPDEIEIIRRAQLGDKQSLNRIAELARERLRVYVWRLTLRDDMTQEIVQETLVEMVKILGKLKRADRFWPWLYGIATNKLHRYHRTETARRRIAESQAKREMPMKARQEGFEEVVSQELREIVSSAMQKLKTRHRAVLVMRCYDEMSYAEIAESMDCTEFGTRMLFLRAKRALQKELLSNGFGKGALLVALTLFGKMTAPSEAAAAKIAVTAAATNVGVLAGVVGLAATKTGIVSLAAAGVLTAGTIVATSGPQAQVIEGPGGAGVAGRPVQVAKGGEQYWYYFPDGPGGAMMMRARTGSNGDKSSWQLLQNDKGNYYYQGSTIYINNHRMWAGDLSVLTVPTDISELRAFLAKVDGNGGPAGGGQQVTAKGRGLLVVAARQEDPNKDRSWVIRHYNVLDEDYFQSDWPTGVRTVDNRDVMHKRGWTYFRVDGSINGEKVVGVGQMPFIYAAAKRYGPWLKMRVGQGLNVIDAGQEAGVLGAGGAVTRSLPGGALFKGLGRPWMGFHTMDTVRRDAAEQRLRFETTLSPDRKRAEVVVQCERVRLVYTVDMEADVVDRIALSSGGESIGELRFSYMEETTAIGGEFSRPQLPSMRPGAGQTERVLRDRGMLWLAELAEGSLDK